MFEKNLYYYVTIEIRMRIDHSLQNVVPKNWKKLTTFDASVYVSYIFSVHDEPLDKVRI